MTEKTYNEIKSIAGQIHVLYERLVSLAARTKSPPATAKKVVRKPEPKRVHITPNPNLVSGLLGYILANPGLRSEQIESALSFRRVSHDDFRAALGKLRKTGQVKTKGVKRAATYFTTSKTTRKG